MKLTHAVDYLNGLLGDRRSPEVAIILGSGLGGLADLIEDPLAVDYHDIPDFVRSTAGGHRGQMIFGSLGSVSVVAMAGRFHRYEGWSNDETAYPVRVMQALGATRMIVSNAAGGVNPKLKVGDIMIIRDHINLMGGTFAFNASGRSRLGQSSRHPIYDESMMEAARVAAMRADFSVMFGCYLATLGPTYETRAEYRMMRKIGGDVVGMSTVPEVLAAGELGMKVLGLSMVSNVADPDRPNVADHQEVLAAGQDAAVRMEAIVRGVLA
ncbi:Purine nucleoside phosphorylase 1 [Rubripirellula amarantea]|uniref:Purine nucleoside phosphorylase n=1 Tax=Rubripirellula amarantea TaxID=2527999 RepID=A0A5C5WLG8_9BACT|nr:purine-nucleoside phosphorylase [Rubripirellula amarantea]TWT50612.1 Purine nucleoside phosphorylase 1 [Rubripirellula amarantea]